MIDKIMSGGQTGADRAALDFALANGVPHGGWCPKGRLAVDGPLDRKYLLMETPSPGYRQRNKWNVRDSDGTLIVNMGELGGGTLLTTKFCQEAGKPCLIVQADETSTADFIQDVQSWLEQKNIRVLNVAGPREEKRPGIYAVTKVVLSHTVPLGERRGVQITRGQLEFVTRMMLDERVEAKLDPGKESQAREIAAKILAARAVKKLRAE